MRCDLTIWWRHNFEIISNLQKLSNFENEDDTKNALAGILAKDIDFPSNYLVDRIMEKHLKHLILKFRKNLSFFL